MRALFNAQQLAQDAFEKLGKELEKSRLDLALAEVTLEKCSIDVANRTIRSPAAGVITSVVISQGESVIGSSAGGATALFEVAADTATMLANIDIDESDIGYIKAGLPVSITVNTYPDAPLQSTIKSVSFSPKPNKDAAGNLFYRALVPINNSSKKFRPGMGITSAIHVTRIPRALCIKSLALAIDAKHLQTAANELKREVIPLSKQDKKEFKQEHAGERVKFIWVNHKNRYIERGVVVGILDDAHVNIKHGLQEHDEVVTNVTEPKPAETSLLRSLKLGS
jgi:HlyD family secretion protein